ncbi:carbohydrate ABC transporter permease [Bifidobacterium sp. ESL0690]|uniref:carbohydrate ABC transporter permease n=1 Tax=Bifidobacterium sp. ESL0690 TaxID=2983214 RepID=UPI0023F6A76D|nr:carbohydrate ABC transporter permease [Bifidobacterium sp. ESL0690]WEV46632.1 carbohydrate ABC transporter permease [Bifidobacterium sp. ESL0690]
MDSSSKLIRKRSNWLLTIFLIFCSLTVLIPMYLTLSTALKDRQQSAKSLWALPTQWRWSNFSEAIVETNFWRALGNSLILTIVSVVIGVLTNAMIGYAIARNMNRKGFKIAYFYIVSAMFIPFSILMLPLVKEMSMLGLDNLYGLIPIYVIYNLPFNTMFYVGYMDTIPRSLDEAAMLDGANTWQTFWKVIFPLLGPANATVGILQTLWVWNDFMLPLVMISKQDQYTIPLTQYMFQSAFNTNYNLSFASYTLAMIPMLIVYLFAQKQIINGVAAGSVKE